MQLLSMAETQAFVWIHSYGCVASRWLEHGQRLLFRKQHDVSAEGMQGLCIYLDVL